MLTNCPECKLQISDKAIICPHCGYPLKSNAKPRLKNNPNRHKRLPNGFGQITKISNKNLRNPYRVMVTVGKTPEGKPISKLLKPQAYFATYNEAYSALVEYNKNPYEFSSEITMNQLFDRWFDEYEKFVGISAQRAVKSAWIHCKPIYSIPVRELKAAKIKEMFDQSDAGDSVKHFMKSELNLMLDYAVQYELVEHNVSRNVRLNLSKEAKTEHITFEDSEIQKLIENGTPIAKMILIQCYTGFRPQELTILKKENINLEDWTITGGLKTKSGINRTVPMHPFIRSYVEEFYAKSKVYLFDSLVPPKFESYKYQFKKLLPQIGINEDHRPHDPRVYFVTKAKEYNLDEYAIKRIVGHKIDDLTERIYTKRNINWLAEEMNKIPSPTLKNAE